MIAYCIVRKDDPEHKPVRARGGHNIWLVKSSAGTAMSWLNRGYFASKNPSEYEIVEYELVEVKP